MPWTTVPATTSGHPQAFRGPGRRAKRKADAKEGQAGRPGRHQQRERDRHGPRVGPVDDQRPQPIVGLGRREPQADERSADREAGQAEGREAGRPHDADDGLTDGAGECLADGESPKEIAAALALTSGKPKRQIYQLAVALKRDPRVAAYVVDAENFESIHNHSAYALIERDKSQG